MLVPKPHNSSLITLQSQRLDACGTPHGFTTRRGGVSEGTFSSLNLAAASDDPANIATNWQRLQAALDCTDHKVITVSQVHGRAVHVVTPDNCGTTPEADAVMTDQPGTLVAVRTADCVPVLLAASDGRAVAAVHAGWRGIVAQVIPAAVAAMHKRFGVTAAQIVAAVGPAISVEHYEVGREIAKAFTDLQLKPAVSRRLYGRPHVNLPLAARLQLEAAGVTAIDTTDECTYTNAGWFYSHRRDNGDTGRQAAVIGVAAKVG